jgi:hypothetical protein
MAGPVPAIHVLLSCEHGGRWVRVFMTNRANGTLYVGVTNSPFSVKNPLSVGRVPGRSGKFIS